LAKTPYTRGRRNSFQAVLVVARVHDPDQLDQKRIELEGVAAAVGTDKRDGGGGTRLDAFHLCAQRTDLSPEDVKESTICSDSLADLAPQVLVALGLDHDPSDLVMGPR